MADWDAAFEADPSGSKNPSLGDDDIRALKGEIRYGMDHESAWLGTTRTLRGVHRNGSAKVYYQAAAPTTKPNSSDGALTSADAGRVWIDSDDQAPYVYDNTTSSFLRVGRTIQLMTTDPATPLQGEVWLRTDLL